MMPSNEDRHVCHLPPDKPVGDTWYCTTCWSEFRRTLCTPPDLHGHPIALWIRIYEPPTRNYVPPERRHRRHRKKQANDTTEVHDAAAMGPTR